MRPIAETQYQAFLLFRSLHKSTWSKTLSDSRGAYRSLKEHLLKGIENGDDLSTDDPLSETDASAWTNLHLDEELRSEIWQDVERCMPENSYFREPTTQSMLLDILFVYCKLNRDIGYRQGMHEVLAPFLWVISCDAIDPTTLEKNDHAIEELELSCLDHAYIEHDAFTLFSIVMQTVRAFYELGTNNDTLAPGLVNNSSIVQRSKRIHEYYLHQTDPELAEHLTAIEILPQIFLIRWVRLVFGREFPFEDVLSLWDVLFAEDPDLDLIDLISVSMLLRIRWQLLEADYTAALTLLLRYPIPPSPHKAATFVFDALYLRDNLNLDGGDFIISKYSARSPETTVTRKLPKKVRRARTGEQAAVQKVLQAGRESKIVALKKRREPRGIDEIIHDTAKGLYLQGEKWGVARALRGAVQGLQVGQVTPRKTVGGFKWSLESDKEKAEFSTGDYIAKIAALEQRNKSLAALLENAVKELWAEQKSYEKTNGQVTEAMALAIGKVQFVQVNLENSSMPLPTEEQGLSIPHQDALVASSQHSEQKDLQSSASNASDFKIDGSTDNLEIAETQNSKPSARSAVVPLSPSAAPSTPPMKPQQLEKTPDETSPSQHLRPSLAQSPYSWMLGEEKPRPRFVATSPTRSEQHSPKPRSTTSANNHKDRGSHRRMNSNLTSAKSVLSDAGEQADDVFMSKPESS